MKKLTLASVVLAASSVLAPKALADGLSDYLSALKNNRATQTAVDTLSNVVQIHSGLMGVSCGIDKEEPIVDRLVRHKIEGHQPKQLQTDQR